MKLKTQVKKIVTELAEVKSPHCITVNYEIHCIFEMNGKTECVTLLTDPEGDIGSITGPIFFAVRFPDGIPYNAQKITYREFQDALDNYVNHLIEVTDHIAKGGSNE